MTVLDPKLKSAVWQSGRFICAELTGTAPHFGTAACGCMERGSETG